MTYRRAVLYNVSDGTVKFHSAVTLTNNVKDPSAIVYNTTIELFPSIDTKNLNIMVHGNSVIACVVEKPAGVVVNAHTLITCICENIEAYPNGNRLYKGTTIIQYGNPDGKNEFRYAICKTNQNAGSFKIFESAEDAYAYIDTNTV